MTTSSHYRWFLCALLFLITLNNYMDRQLLSIVAPTISTELHLRASDIALIINAFLLTYGIGQMFSGRFMDWIGNAHHGVVLPYNYWPQNKWFEAFSALRLRIDVLKQDLKLYNLPADWFFGRSLHFVARVARN